MTEEQIILDNICLVPYCIKDLRLYWRNKDGYQELYDDGLVGLINGAKTYDQSKNIKISSFLCTCIKNEILRGLVLRNAEKRKSDVNTISLNQKAYENGTMELIDFVKDDYDMEKSLELKLKIDTIKEILGDEKDKNKAIAFKLYYGIDCEPMILEDIAEYMNISPETARMRVLKMTNKIKCLMETYEEDVILKNSDRKKQYEDLSFYIDLYGDLLNE